MGDTALRVTAVVVVCLLLPVLHGPPGSAGHSNETKDLPPPGTVDMSLEEAICRRMSVRAFTDEPVDMQALSTVLWHAIGGDGQRAIHPVAASYGLRIYVLMENGVYRYSPGNHSLVMHRQGDYRWVGQYDTASVKLGIVWDRQRCSSENVAGANIGQMGQNVYYVANALGLGTVTTASEVAQLRLVGLPSHEKPMVIMPLGYPAEAYRFSYHPLASGLPVPENSSTSLSAAIDGRAEAIAWKGSLSRREQTQLVWASYGSSYYVDEVNDRRHRTVPSSHGTYPLRILCCNATGIYEYLPDRHAMAVHTREDRRDAVAAASRFFVSSAPLVIVPVLNTSMVDMRYPWPWHYEAAAAGYTALLEATAWNLSGTLIGALDAGEMRAALMLDTDYLPLYVVPLGEPADAPDDRAPSVRIVQPVEGQLYLFGRAVMPSGATIILGSLDAVATASDDYAVQCLRFYVDGSAAGFSYGNGSVALPVSGVPASHELVVVAHDYAGNTARATMRYLKLM